MNGNSGGGCGGLVRHAGRAILLLAALVLSLPAAALADDEALAAPPAAKILLLHSYHQGFDWTGNITRGVQRVLESSTRPIELTVDYMDTRRTSSATHLQNLLALYREKFPPDLFQLVITADDNALLFALRNRATLFPGVPIVFCGFSQNPGVLLAGQQGVTGIVETHDVSATIDLALSLHPGTRRVVVINDLTTSGLARQKQIDAVARRLTGRIRVETWADVTAEELRRRLGGLTAEDVVLLEMFSRDRSGGLFNPRDIMSLLEEACSRPVYTIREGYFGHGVMGGYLTSGALHGEAAARMALRILDGADPAGIPVVRESINPPQFDGAQLRRFGIDPDRLPQGSLLINEAPSFLEEHREVTAAVVGAFASLLLVITVLLASVRIRRSAEEDLAITLHSIGDAVITTDREGRVTRVNPAAEGLTGWSEGAARGLPVGQVFKAKDATTQQPLALPLETVGGGGDGTTVARNTLLEARDGTVRRIADSAAPIRDHGGAIRGMVVVFRDVTEQRQVEERLRQAQKMETVGRLAGGIAHDFNNLLGGIIGYADLIIVGSGGNERQRGYAERIVETAERAAGLTRNLLSFSRKGQLQAIAIDLHQVIRDVISILEQTIDRRIAIEARLGAAEPFVTGDLSQVQSAFLNLGVNARDAMPNGGRLVFSTGEASLDETAARALPEPVAPGRYLTVTVADTGEGMTPDVLEHLFEPFFSTKPLGRGTGLGLAAVYGTIRGHRGAIEVQSAPGAGSSFRVYLPASGDARTAAPEREKAQQGTGCVLVVDDEQIIRTMARDMLRELDYEVLSAADGDEALEIFRRERARISLVILDVVMPKRSGPDTFRALRAIEPGVRVLLSSGFDYDLASRDLLSEGVSGFLQKPFRISELSEKVAATLKSAPTG